MNTESKGRAWYGKIYRKLETILVEVDSLAAQGKVSSSSSDPPGLDDEPEKLKEDHRLRTEQDDCDQKATTSGCRKDPKSSQVCNDDDAFVFPPGNCTGDSNLAAPAHDKVTNMKSFSSNSMMVNQDEFFIEDFDEAPLDTIDLYDMTFREDPSDFDDNLLYATRDRSRQLRSFKGKIMDALTSKRRREKEYEQLAIWFGDAEMGCDAMNAKKNETSSLNTKSSESNVPFASEDSEWELL
ncbi:hypothetical protein Bca4012_094227 [Brassica carinata]|uniref:Uncharacterized protein n=2 Tax=Brassica TaxID=3705 RepID=A0ABQ7YAJ1_BRANA|nr:uncharacterized protein LOC106387633 [Brassica napus]KAG2257063.1 hypothetical protein Bca52824_076357 [Brassica carinata]KAH0864090.1 hypothetical protein HID58_081301 [Brassica napus]